MNTPQANVEALKVLKHFCQQESLSETYFHLAKRYFLPLADELAQKSQGRDKPLFIGINGSQGSGKSTLTSLLCDLLTSVYHCRTCNLSIDDFYHTRQMRAQLAEDIHPLLQTRGVPGTHDSELLQHTLIALNNSDNSRAVIPRFNKAADDRHESSRWDYIETPVDIIFLEGWCVGVEPQPVHMLTTPCNTLETKEDEDGRWRNFVNTSIEQDLSAIFQHFDQLIMLKAPSFDCVFGWRQTQEEKLRQSLPNNADQSGIMNAAALKRFIQHYQRLTEFMLTTLPSKANVVFTLNEQHDVTERIDNE